MAKVEFTGFVQAWSKSNPQHPGWGMRVKEPGQKMVNGEYVSTGASTWRTVTSTKEANVDFGDYSEGDLVEIKGYEYPEKSEYNGEEKVNIMCKAFSVELKKKGSGGSGYTPKQAPADDWGVPEEWTEVKDEETPF